MRRIQNSSLLVALAMALVPVACSQEEQAPSTGDQKQEVTQPEAKQPDQAKLGKQGKFRKEGKFGKFGRHGRKGPGQLLLKTALKDLELSDAQKEKIAALKQDKAEGKADRKAGRAEMKAAMVEAAKAGKIDEKAFEAELAKMKEHQEERAAAQAKLLNGLYAALEPAQRETLVTKVKAEMEARQKRMDEMQAKWADRAKGDDMKRGPHHGMKGMKGMKGMRGGAFGMLRGLELTEDQQAKIDALAEKGKSERPSAEDMKARHAEMNKKMTELLDAFTKDGFDATKFDLSPKRKDPSEMIKKQVAHMNEVLAILTPEQRATLAANIEKGPAMGKGRGMKRGHGHFDRDRPGMDEGQGADDGDDFLDGDLDQSLDDMEDDVMGDDQPAQ